MILVYLNFYDNLFGTFYSSSHSVRIRGRDDETGGGPNPRQESRDCASQESRRDASLQSLCRGSPVCVDLPGMMRTYVLLYGILSGNYTRVVRLFFTGEAILSSRQFHSIMYIKQKLRHTPLIDFRSVG